MKRIKKRQDKSIKEKARLVHDKNLEERKGTGYWLNKCIKYDLDYKFEGSNQVVNDIATICKIPDRKDSRKIFETLLCNLLRRGDEKTIDIPLSEEKTTSKYVRTLEDKKMLVAKRGNPLIPRYSKIYATKKLLNYFEPVNSPKIIVDPIEDRLVILKDENNQEKRYKDTDETRRIKKTLKRVNDVNKSSKVLLGKIPLSTALIAIFIHKFTLYGRLHTKGCYHYQGISGNRRKQIKINGDPVVELDYSGLHPRLLYASEGTQFDDDPYSILSDDPKLRYFFKECLLKMLNSKSCKVPGQWIEATPTRKKYFRKSYTKSARENTESSINRSIGHNNDIRVRLQNSGIPFTGEKIVAKDIITLFQDRHETIAHHFFSDNNNGLKIMNKDAKIALEVVDHFSKKNIPILAIHDSFIVQKQYKQELYDVMNQTYEKYTYGFLCPIK